MPVSENSTIDEFERVWRLLPHPEDSVVRWFAKSGQRNLGDFAETADQLRLAAESLPGWNFYITPNPTSQRLGNRHKAEDVTHWSYLLLDVDPVDGAVNPDPAAMLDDCLMWLGEWLGSDFKKYRPLILDSGRGFQAWIRLDDVRMLEEGFMFAGAIVTEECERIPGVCTAVGTTRHIARTANSYWLKRIDNFLGEKYECRLDTTSSDLPRPMRCPGTVNQKTGRVATIVSDGYRRRGFASKLVTGTPRKEFVIPDPVVLAPGTPWQMVFQSLTNKARTFIMEGWEEPGRHTAAWHTAKQLCEKGISIDQARLALQEGNQKCLPNPLGPEELERQLRTGFGT